MKTTIKFTMAVVLLAVAMISTALVVLPIQEVDARQKNGIRARLITYFYPLLLHKADVLFRI